jgi:hypothetical protein
MQIETLTPWGVDWAWGVPLIVFTVMFHVVGLNFIRRRADRRIDYLRKHQSVSVAFITLCLTVLHSIEALCWAVLFRFLGAIPDHPTAVLYSLNALTAFGHTNLTLERKWLLMGSMEALNGWILFGLSTAYMFVLIEQICLHDVLRGRIERSESRVSAATA